ncbi:MAG TPA: tetratricopeptide repeat protein [Deferrisomatales bacterium]|nr:tetratricopeptide repeat protein [Deferrisomatales bacterium]
MGRGSGVLAVVMVALSLATPSLAEDVPRSARLMKETGDVCREKKQFSAALEAYLAALEIYPQYTDIHYNIGVVYLKGYREMACAAHHFQEYLDGTPGAEDRPEVEALIGALHARSKPQETPSRPIGEYVLAAHEALSSVRKGVWMLTASGGASEEVQVLHHYGDRSLLRRKRVHKEELALDTAGKGDL